MCLILFAYKTLPNFPLVLIANRDEYYHRKTKSINYWNSDPKILAGRDLEAGGTWMGISLSGRFVALTNYRDFGRIKKNAPSRGEIPVDYLSSSKSTKEFLSELETKNNNNGIRIK